MADDLELRVAATAAAFLDACERLDLLVTADGRVSEASAAVLLGYAEGSLRNLRKSLVGPPGYARSAGTGSRYSYRITDLAVWVEKGRESALDQP